MAVYIPNSGEKRGLKSILADQAIILGLYAAQIVPDGNTLFDTLTPMHSGGGYGYAEIPLAHGPVVVAAAADKWSLAMNSSGQAQGTYGVTPQTWTFLAPDVALAQTVYGVFGYSLTVPFDAGSVPIKVGDKITGGSGGATGIVTAVVLSSGSWALGTAAGELYIKSQTGVFQDNEAIQLVGRIHTLAIGSTPGANYANGDIFDITQANSSNAAVGVVLANSGGNVTSVGLLDGGYDYTTANGVATSKVTGGGGNTMTANITAATSVTAATTNTGTTNGGDSIKELVFVEPLTTPTEVTALGQQIGYTPVLAMSTL
jgi:hypothetical protein